MKIGNIVKPNAKGQLVIPKEIREKLGITAHTPLNIVFRGSGFYIYPIREVIGDASHENTYLKVLEATKGKWSAGGQDVAASKRTIELAASIKRKRKW